jgi:hypothetical protein
LERLRAVAKSCNFSDADAELKHQIVFGCIEDKLRARAMEDEQITLENLIKLAKTIETVDAHIETFHSKNFHQDSVNQIKQAYAGTYKKQETNTLSNKDNPKGTCKRFGGKYPHINNVKCPQLVKVAINVKRKIILLNVA